MIEPISNFTTRRLNETLHGRSVHRSEDVPGHNVFKGYSSLGIGDAIDLFCSGKTQVVAVEDGIITRHQNDATKKEVIYLEGDGFCAVYAHVDMVTYRKVGEKVTAGTSIATVRTDLTDPHLHFELWIDGKAISGSTPEDCRDNMARAMGLVTEEGKKQVPIILDKGSDEYERLCVGYIETSGDNKDRTMAPIAVVLDAIKWPYYMGGDGKLYVMKENNE